MGVAWSEELIATIEPSLYGEIRGTLPQQPTILSEISNIHSSKSFVLSSVPIK